MRRIEDPFIQELYDSWTDAGMSQHDADAMVELVTENLDWLNEDDSAETPQT